MRRLVQAFLWICLACAGMSAQAASLDSDIAHFKQNVADLNRQLFQLEEDILHPANTQLAVYLSVDAKNYFVLDSVEIAIDGQTAASHLYSEQERQALKQGGIQRLYIGNLSAGVHKLTATLNGQGVNDHYFRKESTFSIHKADDASQVELVVTADAPAFEPNFKLKTWK